MYKKIDNKHLYIGLAALFGSTKLVAAISKPAMQRMGFLGRLAAYPVIFGISTLLAGITVQECMVIWDAIKSGIESSIRKANEDAK